MLAIQERPTPAPMGSDEVDEEDAKTAVYDRTILPPKPELEPSAAQAKTVAVAREPQAGKAQPIVKCAWFSDAPIVRDTIVDPPPSRWARFKAGCGRFADALLLALIPGTTPARLSNSLPPIPKHRPATGTRISEGPVLDAEHGEFVLLALLRAPRIYQRAALETLRWALDARKGSPEDYIDFVVLFTLSRMRPDKDGRLDVIRLRELLAYMPYLGTLTPSLARLEERGAVNLILDTRDGDPQAEIQREKVTHIELVEPV